jgi:hypothetical protein
MGQWEECACGSTERTGCRHQGGSLGHREHTNQLKRPISWHNWSTLLRNSKARWHTHEGDSESWMSMQKDYGEVSVDLKTCWLAQGPWGHSPGCVGGCLGAGRHWVCRRLGDWSRGAPRREHAGRGKVKLIHCHFTISQRLSLFLFACTVQRGSELLVKGRPGSVLLWGVYVDFCVVVLSKDDGVSS